MLTLHLSRLVPIKSIPTQCNGSRAFSFRQVSQIRHLTGTRLVSRGNTSNLSQRLAFKAKLALHWPIIRRRSESYSSSAGSPEQLPKDLPVLAEPPVFKWLMFSSTIVFAIVVVGGVTRLTESGLSITEWRPITGVLPPLSDQEWSEEFDKYKRTPEFKLLNQNMSIGDFKRIFYMEWGHRILGRVLGVAFVVPLAYFAIRKKLSSQMSIRLCGLAALIGVQGLLGWYMVKSGLEDSIMDTPGAVPRVSHYRLVSHLALAFFLYIGMFHTGMTALKEYKFARLGQNWSGLASLETLQHPIVKRFRLHSRVAFGLVLLTALSGAFVAGLDAGLVYNEWPLMGGRLAPPTEELFSTRYSVNSDHSDLTWRNILENPVTVQFDHRLLAYTTYLALAALTVQLFRPSVRKILPPLTRTTTLAAFGMANIQVLLGITTLVHLVPVPIAAAHQAGSLALLSAVIQILVSLRRPGTTAQAWRKIWRMRQKVSASPL